MSDRENEEAAVVAQPLADQPALAEGAPVMAVKAVPGIQPPTGLNLSSKNKSHNWKLYKKQWKNYEIVAQLSRHTEEYTIALFLYSIGPQP